MDVRDCSVYGMDLFQSSIRLEKCSRGVLDWVAKFVERMMAIPIRF